MVNRDDIDHEDSAPTADRPARSNSDTGQWEEFEDDSWLDDYEEGSTSEEVLDRVKRGMLLFDPDTPPEIIAREVDQAVRVWSRGRITR